MVLWFNKTIVSRWPSLFGFAVYYLRDEEKEGGAYYY